MLVIKWEKDGAQGEEERFGDTLHPQCKNCAKSTVQSHFTAGRCYMKACDSDVNHRQTEVIWHTERVLNHSPFLVNLLLWEETYHEVNASCQKKLGVGIGNAIEGNSEEGSQEFVVNGAHTEDNNG